MSGNVYVIGLAGPSGSGKSTLARRLACGLNAHVISIETYAVEVNNLPFEERAKRDYDAPEATDVALIDNHIRRFVVGQAIDAPAYDFARHLRLTNSCEHISPKPMLIVEGILALHFPELRPHFDFAIYLDAPDEICFHRRRVRDITERQRSIELIRWQYENTVLPAAQRFLLPSKRYADVVIDTTPEPDAVEKSAREAIQQRRAMAAAR